ncbi:MAG: polysaccharide deacetylase [Clostridia bacterium]|nr:polysaccharide deacetylase [Clostridia bacterium]
MEENEKHLNIKKVIITIAIFIFAFLVIIGSALITHHSTKSKKEKKLSIRDVEEVVQNSSNIKDENMSSNTVSNDTENNTTDNNEIKNNFHNEINNVIKPVSEQKVPVYNENCVQLIKDIYSSDEKQIFLTFDDGPSPNVTPQILEILDRYKVPATFFVLGSRVDLYPDLLKQEFKAGHYIANHGYTHSYSSIYSSVQAVVDEFNSTETSIQNALGNPDYHSYLFRFPGGSSGGRYDSLKSQAKSHINNNMGIATTNWNCLSGDAEGGKRTKEQLLNRLYETAEGHTSLVVLMHDADDKQTTADALPDIIEHYMSEGYTFKNYYDIFK